MLIKIFLVIQTMLSAKLCTKIAVFGLFIGTLQSFPQDINFGGRQIGFGGQDDDDRLDTKSGNFNFLVSVCHSIILLSILPKIFFGV